MAGPAPQAPGAPTPPLIKHAGSEVTIELTGELDLASVPSLDRATGIAVDLPGVGRLVIDLCAVEFADSSTVCWLMRTRDRTAPRGIELVARAGQGPVLALMRLTGLSELLPVVPCGDADAG